VVAIFFSGWWLIYTEPSDPADLKYVLWRHGLYPIYPEATAAMVRDLRRDDLVIGKTKEQLRRKFGYLVPLADASLYLKQEYQEYPVTPPRKESDVFFIRDSWWMVVFDGDKAVDLVLCKG